jgi:hypothetical protein
MRLVGEHQVNHLLSFLATWVICKPGWFIEEVLHGHLDGLGLKHSIELLKLLGYGHLAPPWLL